MCQPWNYKNIYYVSIASATYGTSDCGWGFPDWFTALSFLTSSHPRITGAPLSNKISLSVIQHQNTISYSVLDIFLQTFPYITDHTGWPHRPQNNHCNTSLSFTLLDCPLRKSSAYCNIYLYIIHLQKTKFAHFWGGFGHLIKCLTKSDVNSPSDGYYQSELHPRATERQQRSIRAEFRDATCFITSKITRTRTQGTYMSRCSSATNPS